MTNNLIITISRENGSGGHYIGEKLAEKLGINCYDKEQILDSSKDFNIDISGLEKEDEVLPDNVFYFGGQLVPSKLFFELSKVMKNIANRESCIFVGRASDYIFRDYPNVVNIFITGPLGYRISRYSKRKNISIAKAEKEITISDKRRSSYYSFYTNQRWGDAANYNLCIDTSVIGIDGTVNLILDYLKYTNNSK